MRALSFSVYSLSVSRVARQRCLEQSRASGELVSIIESAGNAMPTARGVDCDGYRETARGKNRRRAFPRAIDHTVNAPFRGCPGYPWSSDGGHWNVLFCCIPVIVPVLGFPDLVSKVLSPVIQSALI